jgi:hypothetical protein
MPYIQINETGVNDIEFSFDDRTSPFSKTGETVDIVATTLCGGSCRGLVVESLQFA